MSRRASAPSSSRHVRSSRNGLISASFGHHLILLRAEIDIPQRYRAIGHGGMKVVAAAVGGQGRQLGLPQPQPAAVGPARVGGDQSRVACG